MPVGRELRIWTLLGLSSHGLYGVEHLVTKKAQTHPSRPKRNGHAKEQTNTLSSLGDVTQSLRLRAARIVNPAESKHQDVSQATGSYIYLRGCSSKSSVQFPWRCMQLYLNPRCVSVSTADSWFPVELFQSCKQNNTDPQKKTADGKEGKQENEEKGQSNTVKKTKNKCESFPSPQPRAALCS